MFGRRPVARVWREFVGMVELGAAVGEFSGAVFQAARYYLRMRRAVRDLERGGRP